MRLKLTSFSMLAMLLLASAGGRAEPLPSPDASGVVRLPGLEVDTKAKEVRVECQALAPEMPLEFFAVRTNGPEHEACVRTDVPPSRIHAGLLMIGLEPGRPVSYSPSTKQWTAPTGPPVSIEMRWTVNGEQKQSPAVRWMRDIDTKKPMPSRSWIFVGSKILDDGRYAADPAGYVVSIVNFELTVLDVGEIASSANETLEWEYNPDVAPPRGTKVTMVLRATGDAPPKHADRASRGDERRTAIVQIDQHGGLALDGVPIADTQALVKKLLDRREDGPMLVRVVADPATDAQSSLAVMHSLANAGLSPTLSRPPVAALDANAGEPTTGPVDLDAMRQEWERVVEPHARQMTEAAEVHYRMIRELRRRQQALIDEADRIQRLIDELDEKYQDMTTPRPKDDADR